MPRGMNQADLDVVLRGNQVAIGQVRERVDGADVGFPNRTKPAQSSEEIGESDGQASDGDEKND